MKRGGRRISVDHILLDGIDLPPEQHDVLRARIGAELERRLTAEWVAHLSPRRAEELSAAPIELAASPEPLDIAVQVASRIADALRG